MGDFPRIMLVSDATHNSQMIDTLPDGWDGGCIRADGVVPLDEANPNLGVHP